MEILLRDSTHFTIQQYPQCSEEIKNLQKDFTACEEWILRLEDIEDTSFKNYKQMSEMIESGSQLRIFLKELRELQDHCSSLTQASD